MDRSPPPDGAPRGDRVPPADRPPPLAGVGTLLLLADGRFPAGGHAHSGGLEPAVAAGTVRGLPELASFLRGRLATSGFVAAAFAAAATAPAADLPALDAGVDARTPSPAQRRASRAQGRALLRAGRAVWTLPGIHRDLHHPVALGAVASAAGMPPGYAALVAAYGSVTGPASAAVRLLGLDPYPVHAVLAGLAGQCERVAAAAVAAVPPGARLTPTDIDDLPAASTPLPDAAAEAHATWEVRLFAS